MLAVGNQIMNLKKTGQSAIKTLACLLSLGAGLNLATAQPVLLDFGQTNVAAPYLATDPGHANGTISGTYTSWNAIKSSAATSALSYGDGTAATGLTLTMGQEATSGSSIISYSTAIASLNLAGTGGNVPGQRNLLGSGSIYGNDNSSTAVGRDGFFGGAGSAIGLRLDGLTAGNYLVYVMARNCNSDVVSAPMNIFSFAGALAGVFDFSSLTATTEANTGYPTATYANQYNTFQAGENYVGLSVTVGSGDSLYLAIDGAGTELRGFMNMVEIVPASVPEPATLAIFGLGFFALALVLRKRQTVL